MIHTVNQSQYKAFGLNVRSELHFPELPQIKDGEARHDIVIEMGNLTELWDELSTRDKKLFIQENFIMFEVQDIAIFLIQAGKKIIVSPLKDAQEDIIRLYVLGTCMGALLMQNKVLPLHGSAIAIQDKAYAIVGDSGAGKSTLASAFIKKGFHLLSDDVIAVTLSDDNVPFVTPSYPQQKLWQESLNHFGMETESYKPIYGREKKFSVPVNSSFFSEPLPLAGVIELRKSDCENVEYRSIQRLEQLRTLFAHTYRNFLIEESGLLDWHFKISASIASKIKSFQICRPSKGFTAHHIVKIILSNLVKE